MRQYIIIAVCALMMASCASTGASSSKAGYVQVLSSGIIRVNGRVVPVDEVGSTLRSKGFGPRSPINVHVPEDVSERVLTMVTVSLTRSGFTRVLFIKPQQATSDVKSKQQGKQR